MGRTKRYDRETLVATAMGVFHRHGYQGASTDVLVRELGVNRRSVYAEFGSKEALFAATLGHYDRQVVGLLFGPLEAPTATLDEIEALFRAFARSADASTLLGCLLCNTAAELAGGAPGVQPHVERYFDRVHRAFCNALRGAVRAGQVAADTDVAAEARFLTSSCLGIFVMVRAGIGAPTARGAVNGALHHLRRLRATAPFAPRRSARRST